MTTQSQPSARRIITPDAVLSYPNLFTPRLGPNAKQDDKPQYSCALVFLKGADLKPMQRLALEVAKERHGDKTVSMVKQGKLRLPFRDDAEEKGYPEGAVYINVRGQSRPGVVSNVKDPKTGKPMVITDTDEIYAGCVVRASVTAFYYDRNGNKGVAFGLNNIQKLRDGERLDGRRAAEDEFEATEELGEADLADLDELTMSSAGADEDDDEDDLSDLTSK